MEIDTEYLLMMLEQLEGSKDKYDRPLFEIVRNNIIGTSIISEVDDSLEWIGSSSVEEIPQHWLYYLLNILKSEYPKKYTEVCEQLEIKDVEELRNDTPKENPLVPYSSSLLYSVVCYCGKFLVQQSTTRVRIGEEVQEAMRNAITARTKEIIQIKTDLAKAK
jgi:hypothetical protein